MWGISVELNQNALRTDMTIRNSKSSTSTRTFSPPKTNRRLF